MEFISNYWFLIIVGLALIATTAYIIIGYFKRPTDEQITKVKEWLLLAVAQAEKELGSGTGQLKLRYVYDLFLGKFGFLAKVIAFESFSLLVDEALEKFKEILNSNQAIKDYVNSENKKQ